MSTLGIIFLVVYIFLAVGILVPYEHPYYWRGGFVLVLVEIGIVGFKIFGH